MTSSPSQSSNRGKVVDEFRHHDDMVTAVVKNNLRRALQSATKTMMEEKQEGAGLPTHGLVNLDVF